MRGKNSAKRKAYKAKSKGFAALRSAAVAEPPVEVVEEIVKEKAVEEERDFTSENHKRAHVTEFIRSKEEDRVIEFPFASEEPVERMYGNEVLEISERAMDM